MDRNSAMQIVIVVMDASLSARRAWIEMHRVGEFQGVHYDSRSPQGERG